MDEIKELILDTLHFCMRVDTDHALAAGAMEVYTDLLTHSIDSIRAKVPLWFNFGKKNRLGSAQGYPKVSLK